jgi:hypothetical protein
MVGAGWPALAWSGVTGVAWRNQRGQGRA